MDWRIFKVSNCMLAEFFQSVTSHSFSFRRNWRAVCERGQEGGGTVQASPKPSSFFVKTSGTLPFFMWVSGTFDQDFATVEVAMALLPLMVGYRSALCSCLGTHGASKTSTAVFFQECDWDWKCTRGCSDESDDRKKVKFLKCKIIDIDDFDKQLKLYCPACVKWNKELNWIEDQKQSGDFVQIMNWDIAEVASWRVFPCTVPF